MLFGRLADGKLQHAENKALPIARQKTCARFIQTQARLYLCVRMGLKLEMRTLRGVAIPVRLKIEGRGMRKKKETNCAQYETAELRT